MRRIRGSILDAIRKMDPLPRSLRKSTREVEQISQELSATLGRWPTPKEIAFRMGIPLEQLDGIQRHAGSKFISLEHALQDRGGDSAPAFDPVDEDESGDPAKAADHNASLTLLDEALHAPERARPRHPALRYSDPKPFHEIGADDGPVGIARLPASQAHPVDPAAPDQRPARGGRLDSLRRAVPSRPIFS